MGQDGSDVFHYSLSLKNILKYVTEAKMFLLYLFINTFNWFNHLLRNTGFKVPESQNCDP